MAVIVDSDRIARLARALDQSGAIVARVRPEQATLPTPCKSFDATNLEDTDGRQVVTPE